MGMSVVSVVSLATKETLAGLNNILNQNLSLESYHVFFYIYMLLRKKNIFFFLKNGEQLNRMSLVLFT